MRWQTNETAFGEWVLARMCCVFLLNVYQYRLLLSHIAIMHTCKRALAKHTPRHTLAQNVYHHLSRHTQNANESRSRLHFAFSATNKKKSLKKRKQTRNISEKNKAITFIRTVVTFVCIKQGAYSAVPYDAIEGYTDDQPYFARTLQFSLAAQKLQSSSLREQQSQPIIIPHRRFSPFRPSIEPKFNCGLTKWNSRGNVSMLLPKTTARLCRPNRLFHEIFARALKRI